MSEKTLLYAFHLKPHGILSMLHLMHRSDTGNEYFTDILKELTFSLAKLSLK